MITLIKRIVTYLCPSLYKIFRNEENIKALSRAVVQEYSKNRTLWGNESKYPLVSKVCTQSDIESPWCVNWASVFNREHIYHRQIWEYAYVTQALYNAGMLQPGKKGIVFGCGREPLISLFASRGCKITATDAPQKLVGKVQQCMRIHWKICFLTILLIG